VRIHLVNPSDVSFGTAVITPRWLYVLAASTPARHGAPVLVDETLEPIDEDSIQARDVIGIGIHTGNARLFASAPMPALREPRRAPMCSGTSLPVVSGL